MSVIDEKELREYLEEKTKEELINQVILQTRTYERALNTIVDKREIIDKAIEYINRCRDYHKTNHSEDKMFADELTSLIMILQGKEKIY